MTATITEQVQAIIEWAAAEARKTGQRWRVSSVRFEFGTYYVAERTSLPSRARRR
jgi:hypothetical protein